MRIAKVKEEKERSVVINGEVCLYKDKAPFEKSGVSLKGALEYDPDDDTVRCHECGRWLKAINPSHLLLCSGLSVRDYKLKHGLLQKSVLMNESYRLSLIRHGERMTSNLEKFWVSKRGQALRRKLKRRKGGWNVPTRNSERLNDQNMCPPQALDRIKCLADKLGHTPTISEMEAAGIKTYSLRWTFGGISNAMKLANLIPNRRGISRRVYSKEQLVAALRNFFEVHQRTPTRSDARRGLIPSEKCFERVFGSWYNALAFVRLPISNSLRCQNFSDDRLLLILKDSIRILGRVPTFDDQREIGLPHRRTFARRFGSWKNALKKVGCVPHSKVLTLGRGPRRVPVKPSMVDEFRSSL